MAPKFGDQERITDAEVFGTKNFFAVAGLEIKMVDPVARRRIGLQREIEGAIVKQFMDDPNGEVVAEFAEVGAHGWRGLRIEPFECCSRVGSRDINPD